VFSYHSLHCSVSVSTPSQERVHCSVSVSTTSQDPRNVFTATRTSHTDAEMLEMRLTKLHVWTLNTHSEVDTVWTAILGPYMNLKSAFDLVDRLLLHRLKCCSEKQLARAPRVNGWLVGWLEFNCAFNTI